MLVAAAVCPCPPLLVPEVAAGAAPELAPLRAACVDAVGVLAAARPERLLVVGVTDSGGDTDEPATYPEGSLGGFSGLGVPLDVRLGAAREPRITAGVLPLSLTVGAWLLSRAGWSGCRVEGLAVPETRAAEDCLSDGGSAASEPGRLALLVLGDGSAARSVKAPGYLDERAVPFDAAAVHALRTADHKALAALDPSLAREVQAAGRAPWQVLAGAARGQGLAGALLYEDAPYGVGYAVATWT